MTECLSFPWWLENLPNLKTFPSISSITTFPNQTTSTWICWIWWLGKTTYHPNGCLIVVYHGRIRKKTSPYTNKRQLIIGWRNATFQHEADLMHCIFCSVRSNALAYFAGFLQNIWVVLLNTRQSQHDNPTNVATYMQTLPLNPCDFHRICLWFWRFRVQNEPIPGRLQHATRWCICCNLIWESDLTGWWFQPIWKICSSNWIISPGIGVNINKNTTPRSLRFVVLPKTCEQRSTPLWQFRYTDWFIGILIIACYTPHITE